MSGDMTALVIEEESYEIEHEFVLQHRLILEPVVCSVLVRLVIGEDIVTVNRPSSSDPLMELLVNDALLGELIVKLLLGRNLELCIHFLALIIMVLVVVVSVPT